MTRKRETCGGVGRLGEGPWTMEIEIDVDVGIDIDIHHLMLIVDICRGNCMSLVGITLCILARWVSMYVCM